MDYKMDAEIAARAKQVKFVLTDCDGVLTDGGVYYSERGEALKRFSMRDGMGVERLRMVLGIETGIITGENSFIVRQRADKLGIKELHLGVKKKERVLEEIAARVHLTAENFAFIGDDVNDLAILRKVGFSACPSDAMPEVRRCMHYVCEAKGGHGAFREFAEVIIAAQREERLRQSL